MVVQIVSQLYHPDNFRINDIAAELVLKGHRVSVLTGLPDYTTSRIPKEYKWMRKRKESINGVDVRRVPTIARHSGVFFRILNYCSFSLTASIYAFFSKKPVCDVIFVNQLSPVFQAIPAVIYKWRTQKPLVLYCYDLWPESLKAWKVPEKSLVFRTVKKISSWIYRRCDVIVISSQPFREYLSEVCKVDDKNIVYLPQYAEDIFGEITGQYSENGVIDFLFAGNLGAIQNVDCILRAAAVVDADKPFCIHIVGDGSEAKRLEALASELSLGEKVVFYGRRSLADMVSFYKTADCFLLTMLGGVFLEMTLPGKAQSYISAGKPVLAAIGGEGRRLIEQADCGETVSAGDYNALAEKMVLFINHCESYKAKGDNGRRYYENHFSKQMFFQKFVSILDNM